jgi:tripartite-type tricarboxylate transporter receptor subunit TctC
MERLLPALQTAMREQGIQDSIRKEGYEPMLFTPAEMRSLIGEDLNRWGKTIKDAGVTME